MENFCSDCEEKKQAFSFCSDCTKWLCNTCLVEHVRGKETKHHMLSAQENTTGDGSDSDEFPLYCPLHNKQPLKLFCETCDMLACWNCQLTQHKEHSFKYLDDALQNQKNVLEELTVKVEEKKVSIQNSAKQVQDRLNEVKQMQKKVENQIRMAKMIVINELNKRVNVLMDQLERVTNERSRKLDHQLQAVVGVCRHLEHVLNFINWAVSKKNSIPFLFSKELILFQTRRLLETQCNVDLGPSKIQFRWDSATWSKQLSNLGHLSADRENPVYQECQPLFHPGPGPCDLTSHGHALQPSLLRQTPVQQQYSVCGSHYLNVHPVQREREAANCAQHPPHLPEHLQHQLQLHYSGLHQSISQPVALQGPPGLQRWHTVAPHPGREHGALALGEHVPPMLYAVQAQVHMAPAQQPKQQRVLQPQAQPPKQPLLPLQLQRPPGKLCQAQAGKRPKQPSPPPQPPCREEREGSLAEQHSPEVKQQEQRDLDRMPVSLQELLEQRSNSRAPQHGERVTGAQRNCPVRQQEATMEPQLPREAASDHSRHLRLEQPRETQRVSPLAVADRVALPDSHSAEEEHGLTCLGQGDIPLQSLELKVPHRADGEPVSHSKAASARLLPSCPVKKGRIKRSASGSFKRTSPREEDIAVDTNPVSSSACPTEGLPAEKLDVNWEPSNTVYKSEETGSTSPTDSLGSKRNPAEENGFKEPMNLSVNLSCKLSLLSPGSVSSTPPLDSTPVSEDGDMPDPGVSDSHDVPSDSPESPRPPDNQNTRAPAEAVKVPYVRLERLHICAPVTGPLPVFKVQPDANEEEGNFVITMEKQTSETPEKNISLDNPLTPPNSNPPPPLKDTEDLAATPALLPSKDCPPQPPDKKHFDGSESGTPPRMAPAVLGGLAFENEDWCAVCLNGGELLCCDRCPKVYHLGCHVPALLSFPMGEWLCMLCRSVVMPEVDYDCENTRHINEQRGKRTLQGLSISDQRKCEKLTLYLHCHQLSMPFHEPVSPLARHYYQIIKRPMDLSTIRAKLQKKNSLHYYTPEEFVSDVRLMFMNCAKFNYADSEVAQAGKSLELYFEEKLKDVYVNLSVTAQEDSDFEEIDNLNGSVTVNGFTWPSEEKESVKRKRRRRYGASHRDSHRKGSRC
uniref:Tripartite motif-containing protein 66 n=1 Tax=Callorhinchus milii TaxID=7868 RepID=A0A4W3IXW2_CALMI|eukprot:gi/632941207/ref/XP_007885740.1/ PREDICTED: tripartite motif-containing protein 66 [Callorhinchus milii]